MPDFRVDDTAAEHAKMRAAGPAAIGLWAMGGAYSMRGDVLSDGWVPLHFVTSWPSGKRLAAVLVKVGLWVPETRNGIPGYLFHDWLGYQRSASKVETERKAARDRMARIRSADVRPNKPRTPNERTTEVREKFDDSLSLTQSPLGDLGRGVPDLDARAENRPPENCPKHENNPTTDPCRACGDARKAALAWDTEQTRVAVEARSTEARQRAADKARAIANCGLCDDDGRVGTQLCTHDPDAADRAKRGRAAVQAALAGRTQEAS